MWPWLRTGALPGLVLLAGACAGDVVVQDAAPAAVDLAPDLRLDAPADVRSATDGGPSEGGTPGDQGSSDPCQLWTNWTCRTDPVYRCVAQCHQGSSVLELNCLNLGHCACGLSVSPCGPYGTGGDPCSTCQQAVEQGCCQ